MTTRRNVLTSVASFVLVSMTVAATLVPGAALAENRKIKLQLAWLADNGSAGEVTALKMGYFAEKGLDVEILPGGPGSNTVQETVSGTADIAISYAPPLMYAANRHIPVKSFAASFQVAPLTFWSLGETDITSVSDWKGKTVAAGKGASAQIKALLHNVGLGMDDITFIDGRIPALMLGQADVAAAWPTNLTELQPLFAHPGGYNAQRIFDSGLEFQSNYYIAKIETIENDSDMLIAFLEAVDKGWSYAADHPEEAISYVAEMNEALNQANEVEALKVSLDGGFIYNDETLEYGFGNVDPDRWQRTLDLFAAIGEIDDSLTADDVLDNRVLDAAMRTKR